jgi:HK97 family phage major capsid protein
MNQVEEIKGLIGEIKQDMSTRGDEVKGLSDKLDKIAERVDSVEEKQTAAPIDSQAKSVQFKEWVKDLAQEKTLTVGVPADGGYTVPEDFRPELIRLVEEYGIARKYCTVIPMSVPEVVTPSLTSGVSVTWPNEAAAITEDQPAFGQVKLSAKKMAALVPLSSELLADSSLAMSNLIINLIGESIAAEEDRMAFVGGVDENSDPFDGILNTTGVNSVVMGGGDTTFADITADYLLDMTDSISRSARKGAMFFINRTVLNVIRKLKDSAGNYIWQAPSAEGPGTIWGYPYADIDEMPALTDTAVSTPFVIFGNPRHMYLGDRQDVNFARSVHYKFNQDMVHIRATERVAFTCAIPTAFTVLTTAAA